jgi:hypothetical protein
VSEYDSLIEGYPGLDDPANDPGPLSDEEHQALEEMMEPPIDLVTHMETNEVPTVSIEEEIVVTELRALKSDQRPEVGKHYVIYGGKPMPVIRDTITATEDEFVRSQLDPSDTLKDHDGQRRVRADRTLRMRYRGYVCGEMSSL